MRRFWFVALCLALVATQASAQTAVPVSDRAVATALDAQTAHDFLAVLTGGAAGLPEIDTAIGTQIAGHLMAGEFGSALEVAQDWATGQALEHIAGGSAAALLTAVELGERLGHAAHSWLGEGRLQDVYQQMGGLNGLADWPRSFSQALESGFLGPVLETRIRPVALWLREQDGGSAAPHSFDYYDRAAYQVLLGMRDLEIGYQRFRLTGENRTPEALSDAIDADLRRAAAEALGRRDAILDMQAIMHAEFARREAEAAARAAAQVAAEAEAAIRKDAETEARRLQALATAAAQAEAEARAALEATQAATTATLLPPLPQPQPGLVTIELLDTELLAPDMTAFHIRLTNTGPVPIPAFRADLSVQRRVPGGGVAWGSDAPEPMLAAGQVLNMTLVGTGDIGAVVLHIAAMGDTIESRAFAVAHGAPPEATPAPVAPPLGDPTLIDLPAVYRGDDVASITLTVGALSLTTELRCAMTLAIDGAGNWTYSGLCSGAQPVVGAADPRTGVVTALIPYPVSEIPANHSGAARVIDGRTTAAWLGDSLRETILAINPAGYATMQVTVDVTSDSVAITSGFDMVTQVGGASPDWRTQTRSASDLRRQP